MKRLKRLGTGLKPSKPERRLSPDFKGGRSLKKPDEIFGTLIGVG